MRTPGKLIFIARTELRLGWRRGVPHGLIVIMGMIIIAGVLLFTSGNLESLRNYSQKYATLRQDPEYLAELSAQGMTIEDIPTPPELLAYWIAIGLMNAWQSFSFLSLIVLTASTSFTIPADRLFGVAELIRSTPISGIIYLMGKLLGVIINVLIPAFIMLLLYIVVNIMVYGFVDLDLVFKLTLLDGLPLLVFASALGVLVGVPLRNRKEATITGTFVGVLSFLGWLNAFQGPQKVLLQDIASYSVFRPYLNSMGQNLPGVEVGAIVIMYTCVFLVLTAIFMLARLWLHGKENF